MNGVVVCFSWADVLTTKPPTRSWGHWFLVTRSHDSASSSLYAECGLNQGQQGFPSSRWYAGHVCILQVFPSVSPPPFHHSQLFTGHVPLSGSCAVDFFRSDKKSDRSHSFCSSNLLRKWPISQRDVLTS